MTVLDFDGLFWCAFLLCCAALPMVTIEEMKNSTKYKFVPLFKQIKVNRALVKAFDEYESLRLAATHLFCSRVMESLVSVCVRVRECQGGHGLCQLHTCRVFIDGVYAKERKQSPRLCRCQAGGGVMCGCAGTHDFVVCAWLRGV
jgi:hypothetical protein